MTGKTTGSRNQQRLQRSGNGDRDTASFRWRRRYPRYRDRFEEEGADLADRAVAQPFGDETSMVNALRMRRMYRDVSLRLLADLVELSLDAEDRGQLGADYELVQRAAASSASLYRSLRLGRRLKRVKERLPAHAVLVTQEKGTGAPVEALTQLLAASIARQFNEVAIAVVFSNAQATAYVWLKDDLVHSGRVASYDEVLDVASAILRKRGFGREPLFHILVAAGGTPKDVPASFRAPTRSGEWVQKPVSGYDRIVYLTRELPERAPKEWVDLLGEALRPYRKGTKQPDPRGPYFCSFVATLLPNEEAPPRSAFATKPLDAELQTPQRKRGEDPAGSRIWRDACRLPIKPSELKEFWKPSGDVDGAGLVAFVKAWLKDDDSCRAIERWGRAVTNRQVGVALSGGGASSYRFVPLLKGLDANKVPVDIVSGVSGGALLGAYYSALGTEGLDRCIERGPEFTRAMLTAIYRPNRVSDVVDEDLGEINVDDTPVRFVAVTTALLKYTPPETRTVTGGTLGEAAQASGAAPMLFKPVQVGEERFSDGASASLVPVRILKDCGADFVFAFNCLPGPPRRNPIDRRPGGNALYEHTIVGRLVDLWVSSGSMMQRLSREACEDAHVYFEPANDDLFLIESVRFDRAEKIAGKGDEKGGEVPPVVSDCVKIWERLRRFPEPIAPTSVRKTLRGGTVHGRPASAVARTSRARTPKKKLPR